MPSDSPSQSVSSAISGRRSTIALFIPGIATNPLRIHSLSSSLPCYWSTCNQYGSKRIVFIKMQALLTSTYSSHQFPCFCMSKAKNALRQPVAISLISNQWKEKYNCAFHPRHSNQSTQNPLTLFKLAMLLVYLQSTSLQENCAHDSASTTSFRPCFCMSIARMPSDSPSQSVSSAISGRRSTIALFIPGIPPNPLRIHSLSSSLPCYWSTYNQHRCQENCVHDSAKHYLHLLPVVTSFRPCFCISIAKNALKQPVPISLISNQWKEKYNCAFHPRHSNQSTQNPLTLFKLTKLLVYLQSISLQENCVHKAASTTFTYSSHQFPSLFLHVNSQECPQTARRNQSHQQSVEREVQLRFSSQAFQPIHSESTRSLQAYHATVLPPINIAPRELCS